MRLLRIGTACLVSVLCGWGSTANAQIYNWSGIYVGANVGGSKAESKVGAAAGCPANGYFCTPVAFQQNVPVILANASGTLSSHPLIAGAQVGYNWQSGGLVFGLVADAQTFRFHASRSVGPVTYPTNAAVTYTVGSAVESSFLMTARARLGWTMSNWLFYGTGGLAATEFSVSNSMSDTLALRGNSAVTRARLGWSAGGGVEVGLSKNWTVMAEYLHVDFGSVSTTATVGTAANNNPLSASADLSANILRGGINYTF